MALFTGREPQWSPIARATARTQARSSYGVQQDLTVAVLCRGRNQFQLDKRGRYCHRPTLHHSGYCPKHRHQWMRAREGAA